MRSAGRRVALHVGLLALNVFGIILLIGWREIVVAYHGFRLRSDPAAFDDLLGSEDGSPRREALERYARGSKGRERLLTEYLAVGMGISISLRDELKRLGTNTTENPRVSFWFKGKFWRETWIDKGSGSVLIVSASSEAQTEAPGRRLESLQRLMASSPFEHAPHPDWPGLAFTVFPRISDPPGTEYRFTDRSQWSRPRMLGVTREGTPFPEVFEKSANN
jgi:hypothetical protein